MKLVGYAIGGIVVVAVIVVFFYSGDVIKAIVEEIRAGTDQGRGQTG